MVKVEIQRMLVQIASYFPEGKIKLFFRAQKNKVRCFFIIRNMKMISG